MKLGKSGRNIVSIQFCLFLLITYFIPIVPSLAASRGNIPRFEPAFSFHDPDRNTIKFNYTYEPINSRVIARLASDVTYLCVSALRINRNVHRISDQPISVMPVICVYTEAHVYLQRLNYYDSALKQGSVVGSGGSGGQGDPLFLVHIGKKASTYVCQDRPRGRWHNDCDCIYLPRTNEHRPCDTMRSYFYPLSNVIIKNIITDNCIIFISQMAKLFESHLMRML